MAGIDQYTTALLHFNKDFTDECGNIWTPNGSPQISTTQSKFGGGGLYLEGDSCLSSPIQTSLGTDFSIDFWVYLTSRVKWEVLWSSSYVEHESGNIRATLDVSGEKMWISDSLDNTIIESSSSLSLNNWVHCMLGRKENILKLFFDGKMVGSCDTSAAYNCSDFYIGNTQYNRKFNGYIDEFRISNNICRWTSDFIPPSVEYGWYNGLGYKDNLNKLYGYK